MEPMLDDYRPAQQASQLEEHRGEVERLREVLTAYYAKTLPADARIARMAVVSKTLSETVDEALAQAGSIEQARGLIRLSRQTVERQMGIKEEER